MVRQHKQKQKQQRRGFPLFAHIQQTPEIVDDSVLFIKGNNFAATYPLPQPIRQQVEKEDDIQVRSHRRRIMLCVCVCMRCCNRKKGKQQQE